MTVAVGGVAYDGTASDLVKPRALGWRGVEPRHLVALIAIAQHGSFRAASQVLGLVQSALSHRLIQLEELVGERLVVRSRGRSSVQLTEAGRVMLSHSAAVMAELHAAHCDLRWLRDAGIVRMGVPEGLARSFIARGLDVLKQRGHEMTIEFREGLEPEAFSELVASGELDLALAELPLEPGPFAYRELLFERWVLVVRSDSPLARAPLPPSLAEVASLPLVAVRSRRLPTLVECLRAAGIAPKFAFGSRSATAVLELVAQGAGAALMPALCVDREDPRVAVIEIAETLPGRRLAVFWHRERRRTEPIDAVVGALAAVCKPEIQGSSARAA
jgi:DNA-binding transcriptional LysR family regulator